MEVTLRDIMFTECTTQWRRETRGGFTRRLFPDWNYRPLPRGMYTRHTVSLYYQLRTGNAGMFTTDDHDNTVFD